MEFPAAHSMDTDWYVVDRNGHVAKMFSNQEGAVPYEAHQQPWEQVHAELVVRFDPSIRGAFLFDGQMRRVDAFQLPEEWNGVLRFRTPEQRELYMYTWDPVARVLDPTSLAVETVHKYQFDPAFRDGDILGAYVCQIAPEANTLGLFEYTCPFSGSYVLDATPADPATLDDFPAALRGTLGALRITTLAFADTAELEPIYYFDCKIYRE